MAADLDKVSPNNPVFLMHTTGHYAAVNSYALRLAHIEASTQDPPAGTIDRDARGAPTGVLKESAWNLVQELIPLPTPEQRRAGISQSIETLHQEGMTAVKDPLIYSPTWDAYRQLLEDGRLLEHIHQALRSYTTWAARQLFLEDRIGSLQPQSSRSSFAH